jgi:hypothetical protein
MKAGSTDEVIIPIALHGTCFGTTELYFPILRDSCEYRNSLRRLMSPTTERVRSVGATKNNAFRNITNPAMMA